MGFFACYLLTPVEAPQRLRCTYVGFTVSPTRRIRQHNGELVNGAKRTAKHRPWEMIVVVHGFPSKFHALQFEYAWQHPYICRFTKQRLTPLKGKTGLGHPRSVKRKLIELHEMLHVSPWDAFPLTVSYTNPTIKNIVRTTSFFQWPAHMTCDVRPLGDFVRCQSTTSTDSPSDDSVCYICDLSLSSCDLRALSCYYSECRARFHSLCLADHFLLEESLESEEEHVDKPQLRPERGTCPCCGGELLWPLLVRSDVAVAQKTNGEKKTTKKPSKKRRRVEQVTCASSNSEENSCLNQDKAPTEGAVELDSDSDSNEYGDWNWFEDDADNCVEYLDLEMSSDHFDCPQSSHRLMSHNTPAIVDLTNIDD